jgi:nitrite reductase (cytochrome c-552)
MPKPPQRESQVSDLQSKIPGTHPGRLRFFTTRAGPLPLWAGAAILLLAAGAVVLLGLLAISIVERRWEAQRPMAVVKPIGEWEPNSAVWGLDYPREYESYLKTRISDTKTLFGGAQPRDYLEEDPLKVILFAGSGFSKEYFQARGHFYAIEDVSKTARIATPFNAATCWSCKSPDVPRVMNRMGVREFYAGNFHDLKKEIIHPIGCLDCHDPNTLRLRITRPALKEAFAAMGRDLNAVSYQEMRSLVCAQCHVEYYFKNDAAAGLKNYLTFPWAKGRTAEDMLAYYDGIEFTDFVHPISGTPMLKAQHPDYELYATGVHAYRSVSCADCHMPYRTEGGVKFTDHHVQSPLLNIANSCAVCHRWGEAELRTRVERIQTTVQRATVEAEKALVQAHFDIAAAARAGASADDLKPVRTLLGHAQFRWDYVGASNGMGFHSPQEAMRLLGEAANQAQQVRLETVRLLGRLGVTQATSYPDVSTREKAWAVVQGFMPAEKK